MSRKTAREQVFKLIYERCVNNDANKFSLNIALEAADEADSLFIKKSYSGINENYSLLKNAIEKYSNGYVFERIYKIDCALIMTAAYEILFLEDIPTQVSVNEVLELAKKYSTEKSVPFINGLLASIDANKETILNGEDTLNEQDN